MSFPPGYQTGQTVEQYWASVRNHPEFGKGVDNIKTQPLAHERANALGAEVVRLNEELVRLRGELDELRK